MKRKKKDKDGKEELEAILHLIEIGKYGRCYICYTRFELIRITAHYCNACNEWFCSEHGSFAGKGVGYCLMHDKTLIDIAKENVEEYNNKK